QLHTHVVVANRVQAVRDGRWRTLDSRALHGAVAGLSEHYNAVLSDHVARLLGVGWQARTRGPGRITRWEITGVPQELMDEFSVRTHDLEQAKDRLVSDYVARHGRAPSRAVSAGARIERIELFVTDLASRLTRRIASGDYDTGARGALAGKPVLIKIYAGGVVGIGQIRPIAPSHFMPDTVQSILTAITEFYGPRLIGVELADLALVQLVGIVAGALSSLMLATPLLVDLKMRDPRFRKQAERVYARRARAAKAGTSDGTVDDDELDATDEESVARELRRERAVAAAAGTPARAQRRPQGGGSGRPTGKSGRPTGQPSGKQRRR
ncbi:MAG: relaxase domain-containing protein, partial [Microbacterium sp.]|uniref:relaxase domain-containing protein n=1 Tax=Microbacterium sp. TaxID=51671 RepID=UPI001AC8488D